MSNAHNSKANDIPLAPFWPKVR